MNCRVLARSATDAEMGEGTNAGPEHPDLQPGRRTHTPRPRLHGGEPSRLPEERGRGRPHRAPDFRPDTIPGVNPGVRPHEIGKTQVTSRHMAEGSDESSNLETLPDSSSNPDLDDLFDTLADWNHQLKSAKIDLKGPQP